MTGDNPKLDFVNIDMHTKFGLIFQDTEWKLNSDVNQGPLLRQKFAKKKKKKIIGNNPKLDLVTADVHVQNLVRFCLLALKILSGNVILKSIKGCNSVKI